MSSRILFAIVLVCDLIAQTPPHVDLERQLWTVVKQALNSPEGDEYFQSNMLDAQLPRLKGTLGSTVPGDSGNTLMLGLADSTIPDVAPLVHGAVAPSWYVGSPMGIVHDGRYQSHGTYAAVWIGSLPEIRGCCS